MDHTVWFIPNGYLFSHFSVLRFSDDINETGVSINSTLIPTIRIDYKTNAKIPFAMGCPQTNIIEYNGKKIKLQMWNCTVEKLGTISANFYRGADGILLVYDPNNRQSFENISKWLGNIHEHASDDVVRMLIGNKTKNSCETTNKTCPRDATCTNLYCYPTIITDTVTTEQGERLANEHGIKFIETFADENINIDLALMMVNNLLIFPN